MPPCTVILWFAWAPLALAHVSPSLPPTPDAGPAEPSTSPGNDHGDIFLNEGIPNGDGSLSWTNTITVNNDGGGTDQWDPAVAVNPTGTELFVGYYSRQSDTNNALIMAYGAKAPITANSVTSSTFDCFPISTVAFTNLFNGSLTSTPTADPWLFDHVWVQDQVWLDASADVVATNPPGVLQAAPTYQHFTADDYTWAVADSSYFYYAWRDCSDTCTNNYSGTNYVRADANVRLGKIRQ